MNTKCNACGQDTWPTLQHACGAIRTVAYGWTDTKYRGGDLPQRTGNTTHITLYATSNVETHPCEMQMSSNIDTGWINLPNFNPQCELEL